MTQPTHIGRYRIDARIAEGGMGELYRATLPCDDGSARRVALKVLRPECEADAGVRAMFEAEVQVALALEHENVVHAFEAGRASGRSFLAMELVEGADVAWLCREMRRREIALPIRHAVHIAIEALCGLDYAHRSLGPDGEPLRLVHRDVSPGNVVVSSEGDVKLVDFGVAASAFSASRSVAGTLKGKVLYMSPEQLRGDPLDGRADVYGMGAALYEMLTGRRPFASSGFEIIPYVLAGRFPRPTEVRPELPAALEAIVLRAMERDRNARFPSAAAMADALERASNELGLARSPEELGLFVRRCLETAVVDSPDSGEVPLATLAARPTRLRASSSRTA